MNNDIEIQVLIEVVNKEKNQIIFKPYSSEFKHPKEEYPSKAIDITALDLTKNIEDQLLRISTHYVKQILFEEGNERYLSNIQEVTLQSGSVINKEITTQQLFAPETITTVVPVTSSSNVLPDNMPAGYAEEPVSNNLESTDIFSVVQ